MALLLDYLIILALASGVTTPVIAYALWRHARAVRRERDRLAVELDGLTDSAAELYAHYLLLFWYYCEVCRDVQGLKIMNKGLLREAGREEEWAEYLGEVP